MKKSQRNRQFRYTPELSAGDRTLTSCPPALNKAVKKALLREIKDFKKRDARSEAENSARGGPSTDAYNTWLDQNGGHEPVEANPDVLSEKDGLIYLPSKEDSETARLLEEIRQLFSERELQVWNLVMRHSISYQDTADLLNMSKSRVQLCLKRAKAKFTKYMEAKKNG